MRRVAVITGAASGIGAAVARRLSASGASCVLVDRDAEGVEQVADEVGGDWVVGDLSEQETSQRAVALADERHGRLDLVHLNAGTYGGITMTAFDAERYRTVMGVNVDAVVYGVAAAMPLLKRSGGGSIVVTSSLAGLVGFGLDPIYSMSKHATVGLVRALVDPLGAEGVTIGAVCPAFTDTPLVAPVKDMLVQAGIAMLTADDVAIAVESALYSELSGTVVVVQPGMEPTPYEYTAPPSPAVG